jgi:uncharacterized heparinase superfamily protein
METILNHKSKGMRGILGRYLRKAREKGLRESSFLFYRLIRGFLESKYDRISIRYGGSELSDKQFFRKIDTSLPGLERIAEALSGNSFREAKEEFTTYLRNRITPEFFFRRGEKRPLIRGINECYEESANATVRRANQICEHEFHFLIPNFRRYGERVDWLSSLIDQRRWEIKYWQDIDIIGGKRIGDVRQIWELNRHQYFVTLGKAYWYTGDEKYAKEFVSQMKDWIENNPHGISVNWVHAQEIALRIISWIWAYYFFCDSPNFGVEDQIQFFKSLYLQTEFLRKHLSDTTNSTHNHIISETAGLAMMAIMFPEFRKSRDWWRDGVDRLEKELKRQICEDGVSGETSTNYHFFVLDSFLQIWILVKKNGLDCPPELDRMLEKMIEFSMYVCRPDGTLPIIGDSDSGRSIRLDDLSGDDRRSYLSTGAVLFNRSDMKSVAGKFHEESLWLLGAEGHKKFEQLNSKEPKNLSVLYPDSGYCIMRNDWSDKASQLIFRGGPVNIPKDVSIGHNHADYLSFELIVNGKPFIVDPGVYTYNSDDEWRWYGRKTSSHNTVVVDGRDQFVIDSQRFGLPKIATTSVHAFQSEDSIGLIHASHDGYEALNHPITHHRKIYFDKIKGCWVLTDVLAGAGRHQIDWYFHFDVGIRVEIVDELVLSAKSNGGTELFIRPLETGKLTAEIIDGWLSRRYGIKEEAKVLRYSIESECPCELQIEIRA